MDERTERHGCGGTLRPGFTYAYVLSPAGIETKAVPCWWCDACGECLLERDVVAQLEGGGLLGAALVTECGAAPRLSDPVSQTAPVASCGTSASERHVATASSEATRP